MIDVKLAERIQALELNQQKHDDDIQDLKIEYKKVILEANKNNSKLVEGLTNLKHLTDIVSKLEKTVSTLFDSVIEARTIGAVNSTKTSIWTQFIGIATIISSIVGGIVYTVLKIQ